MLKTNHRHRLSAIVLMTALSWLSATSLYAQQLAKESQINLPKLGLSFTLPNSSSASWQASEDGKDPVALLRLDSPSAIFIILTQLESDKNCAQIQPTMGGSPQQFSWLEGGWSTQVYTQAEGKATKLTFCKDLPGSRIALAGLIYAGQVGDADFNAVVPLSIKRIGAAMGAAAPTTPQAQPQDPFANVDELNKLRQGSQKLTLSLGAMGKNISINVPAGHTWQSTTRDLGQLKEDVIQRTAPSPMLEAAFLLMPANGKNCANIMEGMRQGNIITRVEQRPSFLPAGYDPGVGIAVAKEGVVQIACAPLSGQRIFVARLTALTQDLSVFSAFSEPLTEALKAAGGAAQPAAPTTPPKTETPNPANPLSSFSNTEQRLNMSATIQKTLTFYATPGQRWEAGTKQLEGMGQADVVVRSTPKDPALVSMFFVGEKPGLTCDQGFKNMGQGQATQRAAFIPEGWHPEALLSKDEAGTLSAMVCYQLSSGKVLLGNLSVSSQDTSLFAEFKPLLSAISEAIKPPKVIAATQQAANAATANSSSDDRYSSDDDDDTTYSYYRFRLIGAQLVQPSPGQESLQGGVRFSSTGATGGFSSTLALDIGANKDLALWYNAELDLGYSFGVGGIFGLHFAGLLGLDGFRPTEDKPEQYSLPMAAYVGVSGRLTLRPFDFASIFLEASPRWRYESFRELRLSGGLTIWPLSGLGVGVFQNTFGEEATQRGAFLSFSF